MKRIFFSCLFLLFAVISCAAQELKSWVDQSTPSNSQYFSWINNTNEGPASAQTLINFEFFRWMKEEFGMVLDIYAFDAGAVDGANFYGNMNSKRFMKQFPGGFGPLSKEAALMNTRLGLWGGPDGFGSTEEEEKSRTELMISLCRDYNFKLFKMDAVCGQLRPEKYDAFDRMMSACREYSPDLILLNHRLDLGPGTKHSTTYLFGGAETAYASFEIDGKYVGCPDRSPSYPSNTWEVPVRKVDKNYTYYLHLTPDMKGKPIKAYVMAFNPDLTKLTPEIWITSYPIPFQEKELIFYRYAPFNVSEWECSPSGLLEQVQLKQIQN